MIGYYVQTWVRPVSKGPIGATIYVAFSGWMVVDNMLEESNTILTSTFSGNQWLDCLGSSIWYCTTLDKPEEASLPFHKKILMSLMSNNIHNIHPDNSLMYVFM